MCRCLLFIGIIRKQDNKGSKVKLPGMKVKKEN